MISKTIPIVQKPNQSFLSYLEFGLMVHVFGKIALMAGLVVIGACKIHSPKTLDATSFLSDASAASSATPRDMNKAFAAFQMCLKEKNVDRLEDSIACLPDGCHWSYVDSTSAQNACQLVWEGGSQCGITDKPFILPRVIIACDKGHFVPSYGFCGNHENLEVGTVQNEIGDLMMYNVGFPNPDLSPLAMNHPDNVCSTCHFNNHPYLHSAMELNAEDVLAHGRTNVVIESLCEELARKSNLGCVATGHYLGSQVQLDQKILHGLCRAILNKN